ncbi:MAG: hypothetical protein COS82_04500 [Zetaproteobacteria bacterium CG06_land_8_20_14_3_00_59_53]|nr:MAG: hypothetical protein COX56_10605 [Zetaproteobacteria bacterium CG23_combo_of_CG06-09_8_20_14_all_59_86]PIQ65192.1 MAG: hypothetical protein COV97_05185 [Zetaproteobacteria bacterium CG11_big_fil_rev_8_21_14_0_20_59_439]PIU70771.1 MAG: hypothetical protein COS82_04500 [Zetaproteobacteria bacterium CG06_land_8_20_14_3_00_59_53]PIU96441.1 MAG: hypothetical protein COS62_08835 [Zetaproteobacteria bacterium CG03_land_8_20_14_0_80_59_51]PIY45314.1 MAG: hypothetical protein COZ02_09685 [Zetapr
MRRMAVGRKMKACLAADVRSIALWQFGGVGDMLLATPVILALQKAYPEAQIHVWCSTPAFAGFLLRFPCVKKIHAFPVYGFDSRTLLDSGKRCELRALLAEMRGWSPDLLVNLHVPAMLDWWAVEWWLAARLPSCRTLGFDPRMMRDASVYDVSLNATARDGTHYPVLYRQLLQKAGVEADVQTIFPFTGQEKTSAAALLARQDLQAGQRPVCMHIGARRLQMEGKMWPLERFAELAMRLVEQGFIPLVTGVDSEREMAEALCSSVHACRNVAGCTGIGEMAALISLCDGFIGHDSGPFHIAAAVGTPCVAICGRPDAEPEYLNYNRKDVAVLTGVAPGAITVDAVFEQAMGVFLHAG